MLRLAGNEIENQKQHKTNWGLCVLYFRTNGTAHTLMSNSNVTANWRQYGIHVVKIFTKNNDATVAIHASRLLIGVVWCVHNTWCISLDFENRFLRVRAFIPWIRAHRSSENSGTDTKTHNVVILIEKRTKPVKKLHSERSTAKTWDPYVMWMLIYRFKEKSCHTENSDMEENMDCLRWRTEKFNISLKKWGFSETTHRI